MATAPGTCILAADLHGNVQQYERLLSFAEQEQIKTIILCGDIAPKHASNGFIPIQRAFIENELRTFCTKFSGTVFLMMGNDDAKANLPTLQNICKETGAVYIHNKRVSINGCDIVGYSYVPITPFGIKDWEKWDVDKTERHTMRLEGVRSIGDKWEPFTMRDEPSTISEDLATDLFVQNANNTLYVMHGPPAATALDQIGDGTHVGSNAVRDFIEEQQPLATFHGHIHETVDVSGIFYEQIRTTHCYTAGNHNTTPTIAIILFDPHNPDIAERKTL